MGEEFTGKWLNKHTGKTIIVRDIINDGDNMIVISSIGQIDANVFQNDYIKMSEEEFSALNISPEVSGNQLMNKINDGLDDDLKINKASNNITLDTPIGENGQPINNTNTVVKKETSKIQNASKQSLNNEILIKKVFNKHNTEPSIDFNVNLEDWPIEQLKMLINVLDVSFDEISTYIIKNYLSEETLIKEFSKYLKTSLEIDK